MSVFFLVTSSRPSYCRIRALTKSFIAILQDDTAVLISAQSAKSLSGCQAAFRLSFPLASGLAEPGE
ncbi:hypothetical protein HA47_12790 [Pantoea stewartii subsp. indologenes]|nr:hypothetical protein HA47_12790 [Pantoea stewartii subsp. indologenes]